MTKEEQEMANWGTPQGSGPVMSTVVNIQPEPVVPDHVVWSLFNTIYFNVCCLGFVALIYSVKSRDRKMVNDLMGAQNYASTAKRLNFVALVLGLILTLVFIVLLALVVLPTVYYLMMQARQNRGGY